MANYFLKHKDEVCGLIKIDETDGKVMNWKSFHTGMDPFLGNSTVENMKIWWMQRAVPGSRRMIEEAVKKSGSNGNMDYMVKNLGLSITDTYWICPVDCELGWGNVSLHRQKQFNEGKIPYHNFTSYDPNAALGGQMEKYWDLNHDTPMLTKKASEHYGQQAVNELLATMIHERQDSGVPYVKYSVSHTEDGNLQSQCDAFTSETIELVSAYEIVSSQKQDNRISMYDAYINLSVKNGVDADEMQRYMDYQTLTDFAITNTDEHLLNMGVIRNADDRRLIGVAPIYDSGNSMFFREETRERPFSRRELLELEITSFYSSEEKMLKKVKDKNTIKTDLLPSPEEVRELYLSHNIPENKVGVIVGGYEKKVSFLNEFQNGKTISLYNEKRREQNAVRH